MKRAAIYARFSSSKQNEQSIEGQLSVCKNYADLNDIEIVDLYIDRAATGTNDNRYDFQRMLSDSAVGLFDYVLVYQYDRFARNRRDSMNNKFLLKKNGVKLISATEPEITERPTDLFLEGILDSAAEFYSRDLALKTKRGMSESLKKGNTLGGRTPFGYRVENKKYVIDDYESDVLRKIFTQYSNGSSINEILDYLSANGYLFRNHKFKSSTVLDMLANRKYIGEYSNPFTGERVLNLYPQIIQNELFDIVQKARKLKSENYKSYPRKRANISPYMLTGKLFCGTCGHTMHGISGKSRNGNKYRYYICSNQKCNSKTIGKNDIESKVIEAVKTLLLDDKNFDRLVTEIVEQFRRSSQFNNMTKLEKEKSDLIKEIDKISDAFIEANDNMRKLLNSKLDVLEDKRKSLDTQILKIIALNKKDLYSKDNIIKFVKNHVLSNANTNDIGHNMLKFFVNCVYYFADKIVIYFEFEKKKTVNFDKMIEDLEQNKNREFLLGSYKDSNGAQAVHYTN